MEEEKDREETESKRGRESTWAKPGSMVAPQSNQSTNSLFEK